MAIPDFCIVFLGWTAFYALHSALAADKVKAWAGSWPYYRLIYNAVSLILLAFLLRDLAMRNTAPLFASGWWSVVGGILFCATGLAALVASFRNYDLAEFAGLRTADRRPSLCTTGLNTLVRHPIYAGILLLLTGLWLLSPTGSVLALLAATCFYLPWGIYWEEKKLLKQFGPAYADYQKRVKRLIPGLW